MQTIKKTTGMRSQLLDTLLQSDNQTRTVSIALHLRLISALIKQRGKQENIKFLFCNNYRNRAGCFNCRVYISF